MADLFNQQISATYSGLLKTTSSGVLTSSLTQITDGRGNGSPLYISTVAINFYNAYTFPSTDGTADQILSTDGAGAITWVDVSGGDVLKTGTIVANEIAIWNDSVDTLRSDPTLTIDTNGEIILVQDGQSGTPSRGMYNIGGGNMSVATGEENTGFGKQNLNNTEGGYHNTAVGAYSLFSLTGGVYNVAIGRNSLYSLIDQSSNTAVGNSSALNFIGSSGTFIGALSGGKRLSGSSNTAIGVNSLVGNSTVSLNTGNSNTAIGDASLNVVSSGSKNVALGKSSGSLITTGSSNVIIGSFTGTTGESPTPVYDIRTSSNNIVISDGDGNIRQTFDNSGIATFLGSATNNVNSRYSVIISDNSAVAAGNGGGIIFRGKYTGTTLIDGGGINLYKENSTDGEYGYGLNFTTRQNSGNLTTRLTLAPTGAATFSSSVQIGTAITNYGTLQTYSGYTSPSLTVGTAAAAIFSCSAGQELALTMNGTAPYGINFQARNNTAGGPSGTSYPIIFNPLGGNVGIGTNSPSAKLQIRSTSAGAANVALFLNNNSVTSSTETRIAFAANTNDDIATNRYSYISALNTSGSNGQALIFATNETGNSAVERVRITSGGLLQAKYGISFPNQSAGSGTPTSGGEILDAYEEGTWTPQIYYQNTSDQANATNTTQTGIYTRIGNLVKVQFRLIWTQTNTPAVDNIGIKNIPFIGNASNIYSEVPCFLKNYTGGPSPRGNLTLSLPGFNSSIVIFSDTNFIGNMGNAIGSGTKEIRFSFSYLTN
jgi:hypothetical protein